MNRRLTGVVLGLAIVLAGCSGKAATTAPQTPVAVPAAVSATPTPDPMADVLSSTRNGWATSGEVILSNPARAYGAWFVATMRNPLSTPALYRVTGEWDAADGSPALATQVQTFTLKPGEMRDVKFTASVRYDLFDTYRVTEVQRTVS